MIALDFFGATGREPAESLLLALEEHVKDTEVASHQPETKPAFVAIGKGRIWVTRRELHGD
jgi:hypothetical protein